MIIRYKGKKVLFRYNTFKDEIFLSVRTCEFMNIKEGDSIMFVFNIQKKKAYIYNEGQFENKDNEVYYRAEMEKKGSAKIKNVDIFSELNQIFNISKFENECIFFQLIDKKQNGRFLFSLSENNE